MSFISNFSNSYDAIVRTASDALVVSPFLSAGSGSLNAINTAKSSLNTAVANVTNDLIASHLESKGNVITQMLQKQSSTVVSFSAANVALNSVAADAVSYHEDNQNKTFVASNIGAIANTAANNSTKLLLDSSQLIDAYVNDITKFNTIAKNQQQFQTQLS